MSSWAILAKPMVAGLVFTAILTWFGLLIIRRQVIFVDLAMGQIAALGTTTGFVLGTHPDTAAAYLTSLYFTLLAAAAFALVKVRDDRIPQEAFIGLIYAIAAALCIMLASRGPHGAAHIKSIMTGDLLWVEWSTVGATALVCALVGLFHFLAADRFVAVSEAPEEAASRGLNVRLWDFLFYASFGLVISLSVRTVGVLMVFIFLVAPAIAAMLLADRLLHQLLVGWAMGAGVCTVSIGVSRASDLPTVSTMVVLYGVVLVLVGLVLSLVRARRPEP